MRKFFLVLLLIFALALQVSAHEVPDLTRQGSITVTMCYDGAVIPGGEMTLYRVGDIREDDGNYSFVLSASFAASGIALENVQSATTAEALADFASEQKLAGTKQKIGENGTVTFDALEPGLYLLVQSSAASGFRKAAPFLVSLPMLQSGNYSYQVDASPKVSPVPETQPVEPNPEQPKTGQSSWPIWTFALSALGLVLLLRRRKA